MARDGALDQEEIAIDINTYDFKILYGAANVTHVTRHLLALKDPARRPILTDGTRRAMRQRVTMGGILHGEMIALDDSGKTFADRDTDNVYFLAFLKEVDFELVSRCEFTFIGVIQPELGKQVSGFYLCRCKVADRRPGHAGRSTASRDNLHRALAAPLHAFDLRVRFWQRPTSRSRTGMSVFRKNTRHAAFAANKTHRHLQNLNLRGQLPKLAPLVQTRERANHRWG